MTTPYVSRAGLQIDAGLASFLEARALPGSGVDVADFWAGLAGLLTRFCARNTALLEERDALQHHIDAWHVGATGKDADAPAYHAFLREIGYLQDEPEPFRIHPEHVDPELAAIAGPQLVVPVLNARFVLNAANARWGSLYDALYGTDALPGSAARNGYDPQRGAQAIAWARDFLDAAVPLAQGSWRDFTGGDPQLADDAAFIGRRGASLLLRHNGLHIEIVIDPDHPIGRDDPAGIADVRLEAAVSTIVDLEDSVAAVDGADKTESYANWLGLMKGDLVASFEKDGATVTRRLAPDIEYRTRAGAVGILKGRSLLLVRNVGHLMRTPAVLMPDGTQAFEGLIDTLITSLIALHDLRGEGPVRNSATGSVYIVKPKMHGPAEAAFANDVFDAVEDVLGMARNTIKIGVMDEERRTSANLAACIAAVKARVVFVNTGFLDRTGDEIHTSMQAGAMLPKGAMKNSAWIAAYENRNVQIALACGFSGRAQIGKGMWAAPDRMADMLDKKIAHPQSGASTAWVPSPTAAVLHATHYHRLDVHARQAARREEPPAPLDQLLHVPLGDPETLAADAVAREIDNNAQGILGYVSRWVELGIGCSKVPDIDDIGLMEDRATLRISAQALGNWLMHKVCSAQAVDAALLRMAARVDAQNRDTPGYRPMAPAPDASLAFQAARALVFEAAQAPNGYTEPTLHRFRLLAKQQAGASQTV